MTDIRTYIKCAHCGIPFAQKHPLQKYCSDECARIAHIAIVRANQQRKNPATDSRKVVKCVVCGTPFEPNNYRQKYCTAECVHIARNARFRERRKNKKLLDGRLALVKCEVCGTEFEPKNINHKYCSPECKAVRDSACSLEKYRKTRNLQYPCEKTCVDCGQNFMAYKANSKRCPKCQEAFRATSNIEYLHERYLRKRTSDKPYQPQKNINQIPGLTDEEYAFTPKPKKNPRKRHRSPEENHAIIDDKVRNANTLHISYGEYDACLRQGIDPATYAALRQPYHSYEERAWLDQLLSITGKI